LGWRSGLTTLACPTPARQRGEPLLLASRYTPGQPHARPRGGFPSARSCPLRGACSWRLARRARRGRARAPNAACQPRRGAAADVTPRRAAAVLRRRGRRHAARTTHATLRHRSQWALRCHGCGPAARAACRRAAAGSAARCVLRARRAPRSCARCRVPTLQKRNFPLTLPPHHAQAEPPAEASATACAASCAPWAAARMRRTQSAPRWSLTSPTPPVAQLCPRCVAHAPSRQHPRALTLHAIQGAHPNANLNVLVVPLTRRPLIPGILMSVRVRDERLVRGPDSRTSCQLFVF
jgi:hypothetical protein